MVGDRAEPPKQAKTKMARIACSVVATGLLISLLIAGAAWAEPVRYVLETPGVV